MSAPQGEGERGGGVWSPQAARPFLPGLGAYPLVWLRVRGQSGAAGFQTPGGGHFPAGMKGPVALLLAMGFLFSPLRRQPCKVT